MSQIIRLVHKMLSGDVATRDHFIGLPVNLCTCNLVDARMLRVVQLKEAQK